MLISSHIRRTRCNREQGYVLLTLLLIITLMTIFAATLVTDIKFSIKRDREEEMIHRGVQYSRAVRAYYRKFNRYPAKIEDLENTNQMRFLRKRYKDPLTGKDFRLLHYGEAKLALSGMGGGVIPGASTVGGNGQPVQQGGLQTSSFGGNSSFGTSNSFGQNSTLGSSNSAFGQNSQTNQSSTDASQQAAANGQDSQDTTNGSATGSGTGSGTGGSPLSGQFGGAPIVGVASTSKDKTIREFDKKKKYNEWQFVYDPTMDRGGLITTPYQPQLMTQAIQGMQNMNGQNAATPNGTGFPNSYGNGNSGFGNSPGGMQNTPTSPPSNPPQQQ